MALRPSAVASDSALLTKAFEISVNTAIAFARISLMCCESYTQRQPHGCIYRKETHTPPSLFCFRTAGVLNRVVSIVKSRNA